LLAARIARGGPPGRRVRQIVVDMLHSREFDASGLFCAGANPAPSEAPPPRAVAPRPSCAATGEFVARRNDAEIFLPAKH
jgi:hypothetical protein